MATQNVLPVAVEANITDITTTIGGEDVQANVMVTEASAAASYVTSTAAQNLVTTAMIAANGTGFLKGILVGNPQGSATINAYNATNTSSAQIVGITLPASAPAPFYIEIGARVAAGLTVQQSANCAITVLYR